jgi:mRNA-degrading endonuclease RelE of RelBE toxin-antitoxin system
MKYSIEVTKEAKIDLSYFKTHEKKLITMKIREQLSYEPLKETRNRKRLRENPLAPWELRIGKYRVFYEVENEIVTIGVVAVGYKKHNALYIRGKQVDL